MSVAFVALTAGARHLTPDEALARVHQPSNASFGAMKRAAAVNMELVYPVEYKSEARAYVFAAGTDGYMVLSADDCVPALLGYSDNGIFDANNMPENMRAWLDGYARQIAWASEHGAVMNNAAEAVVKQRPEVAPKLTTKWNQDNPYWLKCPKVGARYCYTGCVATAMAQVMNWHKWPEQPTGSVTYVCRGMGTLSVDYSTMKFEWDKMLDEYSASSPDENKNAVATLMMACGYGANMYYTTEGSGASSYIAGQAMINNFGYDKSLSLQQRQWYGIEEWDDLVYDELTQFGPVYYDGTGTGGGHAFVCDGYSASDGLFHFNWGWSGMSDGYFRLSALNPGEQGAGGVSPGYNWEQSIMRGLRKAQPDSEHTYVFAPYMGLRSPMTDYEYVELGKQFTMLGYDTSDGFCNYSLVDLTGVTFGAHFKNKQTGESVYVPSDNLANIDMPAYTRRQIIRIPMPTDFPEGLYELRPTCRVGEQGSWLEMKENPMCMNYFDVRVEDGRMYMSMTDAAARVVIDELVTPEYFTSGSPFSVRAAVENIGTADFNGLVRAVFVSYDEATKKVNIEAQGDVYELTVKAGSSVTMDYTSSIVKGELVDGEYYLCFGNANTGEIVSDFYEAKVGNRYGQLKMSYYNFTIASKDFVDRDRMQITAEVSCTEGMYNGPVVMAISTSRRDFKPEWVLASKDDYEFTAVESKPVEINGVFPDGELGMTYYALLGYPDGAGSYVMMADNPISFTVGESSGVDDLRVRDDVDVRYDSASGMAVVTGADDTVGLQVVSVSGAVVAVAKGACVDMSALPAGVYVVLVRESSGCSSAVKLVKP